MNYPHIVNSGEQIYPVTSKEHLKGWRGDSFLIMHQENQLILTI